MEIQEAFLHRIDKEPSVHGAGSVSLKPGTAPLVVDELLINLTTELCALFNRTNVSYGTFGETTPFPERLLQYSNKETSIMQISGFAMNLLKHFMEKSNFATGGYALFVRYTQNENDFFMIAMLKQKVGPSIDDDLRLLASISIDLTKLHEASRINLTRRSSNEQPYLAFVKGQAKAGQVTEYFRDALSCTNYTDPKYFTQQAINIASAFVESRLDLTDDQKRNEHLEVKRRLVSCFDAAKNTEITPLNLAVAIYPDDPEVFVKFSEIPEVADKFHIKSPFKPNKATYRGLRRIIGNIGTVKIAFDVDDVQSRRVLYDQTTKSLIVKNPGPDLIEKIRDATPTT